MSVTITLTFPTLADAFAALGPTAVPGSLIAAIKTAPQPDTKEAPKASGKPAPSPQAAAPSAPAAAAPSPAVTPADASEPEPEFKNDAERIAYNTTGPLYAQVKKTVLTLAAKDAGQGAHAVAALKEFGVDHANKLSRQRHQAFIDKFSGALA